MNGSLLTRPTTPRDLSHLSRRWKPRDTIFRVMRHSPSPLVALTVHGLNEVPLFLDDFELAPQLVPAMFSTTPNDKPIKRPVKRKIVKRIFLL